MTVRSEVPELPDWGGSEALPAQASPGVRAAALLGLPGAGWALLLWAALGPAPAAAGALVYCGVVAALLTAQRRRLLAATEARRPAPGEAARLEHLVSSLAGQLGTRPPEVFLIGAAGPAALIWGGRRPLVAMSPSMIDSYAHTELEAVAAHSLVRLRSPRTRWLPAATLLGGARLGRFVDSSDDLKAVAITRYPPALGTAIGKSESGRDRWSPARFAAHHPSHRPPEQRIEFLSDL
jgi:hypothetical protein